MTSPELDPSRPTAPPPPAQWGPPPPSEPTAQPTGPLPPTPPGPPPPPGAGTEQPSLNGLAVASLVTGILAPCTGVLSVIFGVMALSQIRRTGQRGRGLAVGGLAATGAWVVVLIIGAIVYAIVGVAQRDGDGEITSTGRIPVEDVTTGDCLDDLSEGERIMTVLAVPCGEPHEAQVYATFALPGNDYPGEEAVFVAAEDGCLDRLEADFPAAYDDEMAGLFYLYPTSLSWTQGDREIVCIVEYLDGKRTGSLLD